MPKNFLVIDIETQKSFKEVGKSKLEKLKISCLGVYDYLTDQYYAYEEKEIMQFEKRLREADLVIGFNIRRFDMPVLAPYLFSSIDTIPILDLLEDVEKARGHRASLDSIAGPTLKQHKSGNGADALILFKENKMDELKRYCLEDVRLTKEVFEYGCREGKVQFTSNWDYKTYQIPVDWKNASERACGKNKTAAVEASFPTSLF